VCALTPVSFSKSTIEYTAKPLYFDAKQFHAKKV
jgi:hypothetical protein